LNDSRTYLTRMILFLVAVGAGCGLIAATLVGIFMVNPALNGSILAVILVGIALNFRQVLLLGPEARWLEKFRAGAEREGETLEDQRTGAADSDLRLLSPMARMLAERRARGRLTLSAPAMRTLLDGISARLDESRELSRYFTGLCIFLGLLGTFWGLLGTVSSVSDVIRGLSVSATEATAMFDAVKEGLEAPLSGMGTAFSSSLFGLAGSLVLGFLDLQAGQAQNKFFNELEEWLSGVTRLSSGAGVGDGEQSVSAYTEALLEQTAERLEELEHVLTRGEQARIASGQQFSELNEKLGVLADQMRTETQVLLRLAESQKETLQVLKRLAEVLPMLNAPTPGGALDDASRGHLRNIDSHLARLSGAVETGRDDLVRELRGEIRLLAKTLASRESAES
jgi:biopolymer transport protein ExbB/TolQ